MSDKSSRKLTHNKWIAFAMWFTVLATTLITSIHAISVIASGALLTFFGQLFLQNGQFMPNRDLNETTIVAGVSALLALVAIGLLISAWLRLVALSQALVTSYAWLEGSEAEEQEDSTIFYDLLNFPITSYDQDEQKNEPDLSEANSSLVSETLRYLAFTWVALLAMSPVTLLAALLF